MRIYHGPDPEAMVGALLLMMRSLSLDYLDEFVRVRGGSVVLEGSGVLLPTPDDRPETATLIALMLSRGAGYLGDDVSLVDPVLRRLHPSAFPLLVDADAASRIGGPGAQGPRRRSRRATRGRHAVALESLGSRRAEPAPVRWVVFPSFEPGSPTRIDPGGGAMAVFGLSQACANLDVWEERALMLFRGLAEDATVSRLVVGSLEDAADLLTEAAPSLVTT
jgi:hypothetical protein